MKEYSNTSYKILKTSINGLKYWHERKMSIDDFVDSKYCSSDIRRTVTDILFSYFRNKAQIDSVMYSLFEKAPNQLTRIISITLTQAYYQTGIAAESAANIAVEYAKSQTKNRSKISFLNAVLRKALQIDPDEFFNSLSNKKKKKYTPGLHRRWCYTLGKDYADKVIKQLQHKADFTFRVTGEITENELEAANCIKLELPEWADEYSFYTTDTPEKIFNLDWLSEGKIYIQDPATVLAPSFMNIEENDKVLDMCCAPGGKSIALSGKLKNAELTACDISENRQELTRENFERYKLNHKIIVSSALEVPFENKSINKILLDVPCSNTGVIRKRPDAIWRFSESHMKELVGIQSQILRKAAELLCDGGEIVYSTCSIEPEENQIQIEQFAAENPDFTVVKQLQLLPCEKHDGGYAALLKLGK